MGEVVGKLAVRSEDEPRGPDVVHSIAVPPEWLTNGETIEVELPRNLTCAKCEGGGCDACERAGAVSLRGKQEPGELLQVSLPARSADSETRTERVIVLRIPEHGGFSETAQLPRGFLLLRVTAGRKPDAGVSLCAHQVTHEPSTSERELRAPKELVRLSMLVGVILLVLFLLLLRLSGWL